MRCGGVAGAEVDRRLAQRWDARSASSRVDDDHAAAPPLEFDEQRFVLRLVDDVGVRDLGILAAREFRTFKAPFQVAKGLKRSLARTFVSSMTHHR